MFVHVLFHRAMGGAVGAGGFAVVVGLVTDVILFARVLSEAQQKFSVYFIKLLREDRKT